MCNDRDPEGDESDRRVIERRGRGNGGPRRGKDPDYKPARRYPPPRDGRLMAGLVRILLGAEGGTG